MTNYNYGLGFKVNRAELAKFAATNSTFKPEYDNTTRQPMVKLIMAYERDETFNNIRKKKKENKHTIQVHASGKVTQSGPRPELMRDIYNYFMEFIEKFKIHMANITDNSIDSAAETTDINDENDGIDDGIGTIDDENEEID
jgi:TATA-box binding protein (TBP) (component of TFIID and TFIIIB)